MAGSENPLPIGQSFGYLVGLVVGFQGTGGLRYYRLPEHHDKRGHSSHTRGPWMATYIPPSTDIPFMRSPIFLLPTFRVLFSHPPSRLIEHAPSLPSWDTSVATFFSGKGSETLTIASGSGTPLLREQVARNCLGRYSCRYFFTVSLYIFFSLQLLVDIIMDFFGFV